MRKNVLLSIGAITTLGIAAAAAVIANKEKITEVARNATNGVKNATKKVIDSEDELGLKLSPDERRKNRIEDIKDDVMDELFDRFGGTDMLLFLTALEYIFSYAILNKEITLKELEGLKYSDGLIMDLFDESIKTKLRKLVTI